MSRYDIYQKSKRICEKGKESKMKITSSAVTMASSHSYESYSRKESLTMEAAASKDLKGAILTLSKESQESSYLEDMKQYKQQQEKEVAERQKKNQENLWKKLSDRIQNTGQVSGMGTEGAPEGFELQLELLKKFFGVIKDNYTKSPLELRKQINGETLDLRSSSFRSESVSLSLEVATEIPMIGTSSGGTLWQRVTATSGYTVEKESTAFSSTGKVQTADGRSIDFRIEVGMSRAFMSKINTLTSENYILTDPLVINLDTDVASVTDQKFFFDLDSDGKEEEISFAGEGSGFLALDKNGDGKINDGNELFGTQSGDGFSDLSQYDEDGNGWIDENDSIFDKLKVWIKDKEGNDILLDLKKADVGAIYLGNADTEFTQKNDAGETLGVVRKTGIYLKESSGEVGTVNHVDLAV